MKQTLILSVAALLLAALICAGCKTPGLPTGRGYTALCQTYVGNDATKLIDSWGQPGRTFDAPDQKRVFVYVETADEYTMNPLAHAALIEYPPRIDPRKGRTGETVGNVTGQSVPSMDYCITYFEVDRSNRVARAYWKGDCRSLEKKTE
ncbi:MAG: hypothetical protein JRJ09_04410 [Deltaproteobacteria bacterium]|nr:hypothetical protein [Deltaproteobacteria bacterium]MBW2047756.1 hypothetical protein [Deltaproteobacteria bacterium]MBW2110708.1 hypothetical protein [Deltaproteobacteria bacterium]MBW2351889.1 hypothetical protein [Deltaproteobacteria bacterium]HDZ90509.1 hypothetical protein [Deltaproteobacteria bacterium]